LEVTNIKLKQHQEELHEVNALLKEQNEELMQQEEELQSTLENLQKTQEQLFESEKMAGVGGIVAGVAHESNTPVGVGITAITNLRDELQRMTNLYEKDEISRENFREF
jgi:C4-dicarboxylate-specific signal transduction histidine kinase